MLKDFKAFLMKGNLVDIAVALILALAFKSVVDSFLADIVTPIIAGIFGQPDFGSLSIDAGDVHIRYGSFLNVMFAFILVGFVMFLVVKAYGRFRSEEAVTTQNCRFCKTDIALDATRCPNCTSQLSGASD